MKVFVTGGAGFVGSNLVHYLLKQSRYRVTVFDALTYAGNRANLNGLDSNPAFNFIQGDVCDRQQVSAAIKGHDAVIHLAAESHVDRSIAESDVFAMTNCVGTNVVCDVARRQKVERFVHVGTDEVYGSVDSGQSRETDLLTPSSPYSASKAASDLIALSYFKTFELPVVVTRSANQFGPRQHVEKLIPRFITNLLGGRKVPIYGNGQNVRSWMFVEDNCAGIELLLRSGQAGEIYHLGGSVELANLDVTRKLLAILEKDESAIEFVPDRLGHDVRYSIDSSKAIELGWRNQWDFDDALARTVDWYRVAWGGG